MKICDFDHHFHWSHMHVLNFVHLGLKRCHSIAKRLIFQNVKKIEHSPIKQFLYYSASTLDYRF